MSIRIRIVDGYMVALCAAKTKPKKGDIYLDDNIHHALSTKFAIDWNEKWTDPILKKLTKQEEYKKIK